MIKRYLPFLFLILLFDKGFAQDYKGLWHGYITEYDYEPTSGYVLQVKEHKGNIITGKAYIYGKRFFVFQGILDFIGTIDGPGSKITELVILKSEVPVNMYLCIKFMNLGFNRKDGLETLTGHWSGSSEKSICRPGEVYLKRYSQSDSTQKNPIPDQILDMIRADNAPKMTFFKTELTPPIIIDVKSPVITLALSDYLIEDNDTVSVYLNRQPIITDLLIKKRVFKKTVRLDKLSGLNEIIMYAQNLGRVPPNTCVLTVDDGKSRQRVNIVSSKESSAVVYLNFLRQ